MEGFLFLPSARGKSPGEPLPQGCPTEQRSLAQRRIFKKATVLVKTDWGGFGIWEWPYAPLESFEIGGG